jgi:hypothetical protein
MAYLAEGRPLLAIVEPESELAKFVEYERIGLVASGNPTSIRNAIERFLGASLLQEQMQDSVRGVYGRYFDEDVILDRWSALASEVCADGRSGGR